MSDVLFQPLIPMSLWLLLTTTAGGMLGWYAVRRPAGAAKGVWWGGIGLWGASLAAVLVVLLNPTLSRMLPPPPGKPVLTVLLDSSGSMGMADEELATTRFAAGARTARSLAQVLGDQYDIRIRTFDKDSRLSTMELSGVEATGSSSDLAGAIASALSGDVAAGEAVVLLSDGIQNVGGSGAGRLLDAVRTAKAMNAPIYTKTFGGDANRSDLALTVKSPQELALVGQRLPVSAHVSYSGTAGFTAQVTLMQGNKEIARRTAVLGANGSADVHFSVVHDKVGVYPYEVRVNALPGESTLTNNASSYVVRVVDEPVRILVLEGKPYWDSKFFTRTLASDPAVALDCVVRLTEARLIRRVLTHSSGKSGGDGAAATQPAQEESWQVTGDAAQFLSDPEKLRGYQVVVLGRDAETFITEAAGRNLQEWVAKDGGSLVCYRGSPTTAANPLLARLMPVRWAPASSKGERFRMSLTDKGESMDWFTGGSENPVSVNGMPSLVRTARVDGNKPLAVVLATAADASGQQQPAVVYQAYGSGRVVVVEGGGMWRWAFLSPQYQDREKTYSSMWQSLMRWLTSDAALRPGQQLLLRADKVRFSASEPASVTLLARESVGSTDVPAIELIREGELRGRRFTPAMSGEEAGVYRVNFGALPEGTYDAQVVGTQADDASARVVFDVRRVDQEMLDLQARPELMARIAAESGGATLTSNAGQQIDDAFKNYQARTRPRPVEKSSAWDRWWVFGALLGGMCGSWMIRRSGGLV